MKPSRQLLGNRDFSRALNRSTVLNMIKTHGPIARAEVARRTGLSAATITDITAGLLNDTEIRIDTWGDDAWARGAAGLVLRKLFESPMYQSLGDL